MDYVYVVTVSARGADKGEFFGTPTAFEDQVAAELLARQCQKALGGRFFRCVTVGQLDHVIMRWDSDEFSVWLERLIFEGAQ